MILPKHAPKVHFKGCAQIFDSHGLLDYDRTSIEVEKWSEEELADWEVFQQDLKKKNAAEQAFRISHSDLYPEKKIPRRNTGSDSSSNLSITSKESKALLPSDSDYWGTGSGSLKPLSNGIKKRSGLRTVSCNEIEDETIPNKILINENFNPSFSKKTLFIDDKFSNEKTSAQLCNSMVFLPISFQGRFDIKKTLLKLNPFLRASLNDKLN